jgi:hypothetical protein
MQVKFMALALGVAICGCTGGSKAPSEPMADAAAPTTQCMKDTDCKGDRICDKGSCTSPTANVSPLVAQTIPASKNAAAQSVETQALDAAVGSGADCAEGTEGIPTFGSSYNGGIYLCREPVDAYWNDWYALQTFKDTLHVQSEGKTSAFSGHLTIVCSTGAYFWSNASDMDQPLAPEDIASVVPTQVVAKAKQYLCKS